MLDVPLNHQPQRAAFHHSSVPLGEGSVLPTPAPQGFFGAICGRPCTNQPAAAGPTRRQDTQQWGSKSRELTAATRETIKNSASGGPPLPQSWRPRSTCWGGRIRWSPNGGVCTHVGPGGQHRTHVGRKGTEKRCPLAPAAEPLPAQARRRDRRHHRARSLLRQRRLLHRAVKSRHCNTPNEVTLIR